MRSSRQWAFFLLASHTGRANNVTGHVLIEWHDPVLAFAGAVVERNPPVTDTEPRPKLTLELTSSRLPSLRELPVENTQVGPFLIVKKLGTNRRHRVYHARQTEQNRDVALKFIAIPPNVPWDKAVDKIEREVNALQQLDHPNLVKVHGAGVDGDKIFFASELVEGESLTSVLARRGRLTTDLVVEYGSQIADLLRYLHQKDLIHSKLTPDKILITSDNQVKVADLRLNRAKRRRWDAVRQRELDIAAYMAPEQFAEGASPKSDLYALGVMVYEMLTGKLPYAPDTMGRMKRNKMAAPVPSVAAEVINCPIGLDKIVSQMLNPNARQRPYSARAVALAFEELRKNDVQRKAAVDQMAGTFNPLNAGIDKSEARKLLGKQELQPEELPPFHQRLPFLVGSLVLIGAILVYTVVPESDDAKLETAQRMVESIDSEQWTEARDTLKPIMERGGPLAAEAERLFYESRQKTLLMHAERQLDHGLVSENSRRYIAAAKLEQEGQAMAAVNAYSALVDSVANDGDDRHVNFAAKERIANLSIKLKLPTDVTQLRNLIEQASKASTAGELVAASNLLGMVMLRYAGEDEYEAVVQLAERALNFIGEKTPAEPIDAFEPE